MPLYEFACPKGHVFEKIRGLSEGTAPCSCGDTAVRAEVNKFAIAAYEPVKETRSDVRSFQEASMEVDYAYTKRENDGDPVKRPNLWKQAKKQAKAKGL